MTLYELRMEYKVLLEMAEDPETDAEIIADTLECIDGELEDKADNCAVVITEMLSDADKIDTEIKRLQERKKALQKNVDTIKSQLMQTMVLSGKRKIQTTNHTFTVRKNGGKLPIILNEGVTAENLPEELCKVKLTPDMDKIREELEHYGDGYCYAHFGERGESLVIK